MNRANTDRRGGHCLQTLIDSRLVVGVPRGETMLYSGTDPESYIAEYSLVYDENASRVDFPRSSVRPFTGLVWSETCEYRGTSLIRNDPSPRTTIGP